MLRRNTSINSNHRPLRGTPNTINMTRYIPFFIFSLFSFLCSCTSDIDQTGTEKQRVTLTLSLGCRDMVTADFLQPQADDTPAAVAEVRGNVAKGGTGTGTGTDLIRNAYVVMCKDGTVEHIYHVINEDGNDFERHQVASISTETGEYTFYSFANLQFNETVEGGQVKSLEIHGVEVMPGMPSLLSVTFKVGEALPKFQFNGKEYDNVDNMVVSCEYNHFKLDTSNGRRGVPMSNKETHTIDNNMTLVLSLYRLLAKMQMTFNNKTAQPIRILKIETDDITKNTGETLTRPSCTYLFPPFDGNGLVTTDFKRITSHEVESLAHYDKSATPDECQEIAANGTYTFPDFYINDSEATNAMKSFPLTILMQRQNAAGEWVNDERKALIQLPRIPRNTVAYVKINLTDYVLKLKAFTYAPIGGYPPFVVEQNDDFYVKFTRPGDFELRPSLYKYVDSAHPENWIDLNDKTQVADAHIDVADPNGILDVKPTLDPVTGEIIGSIGKAADGTAKKGTATIRLTINIVNAVGVIQPYTRTIYVVVE